ncbi:MAG: hypothetical protein LBV63_01085 [Candidatus Methanoplasma sp.]|jgi:hypothetical protein|nr:hypothetical protein [Candidatus Methanoplasma sp.]
MSNKSDLKSVLSDLASEDVKKEKIEDNIYKNVEKAFIEDGDSVEAILSGNDLNLKVLASAYLYGRTQDDRYLSIAVNAAAGIYSLSAVNNYSRDVETIRRFKDVKGSAELADELAKRTPEEDDAYSQDVLWRAFILSDLKLDILYRLAVLPLAEDWEGDVNDWKDGRGTRLRVALYVVGKPLRCDGVEDKPKENDPAHEICDSGPNDNSARNHLNKEYPELGAEYELAFGTYTNNATSLLPDLIKENPQAALNLLREWPGKRQVFHKQAFFARKVWEAGIGKEEYDRYVKAHEEVVRIALEFNNNQEDIDRLLDFVYGRKDTDITDVHIAQGSDLSPIIAYTDPFVGIADFPARLYRFIIYSGSDWMFGDGEKMFEYLNDKGMGEIEIFKHKLLKTKDPAEGFELVRNRMDFLYKVRGSIMRYYLFDTILKYFTQAQNPGDLDFLFEQYLKENEDSENRQIESYLESIAAETLSNIIGSYSGKEKVLDKIRSRVGGKVRTAISLAEKIGI